MEMPEGSLAYRLRVARLERGLTLRKAAEVTGVDKATISAIERNQRSPYDVTLARLAKGYGVSIADLLEDPVFPLVGSPG
jgi:transcriptional regulator with XRE-family HTH domain